MALWTGVELVSADGVGYRVEGFNVWNIRVFAERFG